MQVYTTDWMARPTTFYNEKTGKVSTNLNEVIDYNNLELHPEGVINFLEFGQAIFEQTPVKHVKFMRHSSRLTVDDAGKITITEFPDPVEAWIDRPTISEQEAVEYMHEQVQRWEAQTEGDIILPSSGGYDSRLIAWMIKDKSRIRAFTYGLSANQAAALDVVYAREVAQRLGTRWEQIPFGDFNVYMDDWYELYGPVTHAHAMYQIDFYKQLVQYVTPPLPLTNGALGDLWCGTRETPVPHDIWKIPKVTNQAIGMRVDAAYCLLKSDFELRQDFLDRMLYKFKHSLLYDMQHLRWNEVYLNHLHRVPAAFGFQVWLPFYEFDIAMRFRQIPLERRKDRIWEQEFFRRVGLNIEGMRLRTDPRNTLNRDSVYKHRFKPLNIAVLREIIQPAYLEWINRILCEKQVWDRLVSYLWMVRKAGGAIRRLGIQDRLVDAYNAYLTLYPLQRLLERRGRV